MYQLLWTLILAPALLLALFPSPSSAGTVCDASYYGNPDPSDCLEIFRDNHGTGTRGLESHDRRARLFYTGNLDRRPSDVSPLQWRNKLNLAETIYTDGCNVLLAVGFGSNGMTFQYDTGSYRSIARQANQIQLSCRQYSPLEDSRVVMQGGQGWSGDREHILTILFSNTSAFAASLAKRDLEAAMPDLKAISVRNPPTDPDSEPRCGRSQLCSKTSDCAAAFGCICVADKWHGEFFTSTCKWPLPHLRNWRGLLGNDSANATGSEFSMNITIPEDGTNDLACPCNCTYVSRACCNTLSGIVQEAPNKRLGSLVVASAKLACDAATGKFQASNMTLDVLLTTKGLVSS